MLRQCLLGPIQWAHMRIEGCHGGSNRGHTACRPRARREGSYSWSPAALALFEDASSTVIIEEPVLNIQA